MIAALDETITGSEDQHDFGALVRSTARILHTYLQPEHTESQLWSSIAYLFMYFVTETAFVKNIVRLPLWTDEPGDTTRTISIFTNANGEFYLNGDQVPIETLCEHIRSSILERKGVHLKSERSTPYKAYLAVHSRIQQCVYDMRNEKSEELYQMSYDALDDEKKEGIKEMIPLRIVEGEPKRE
jgi:hypothetical protein